MDALRKRALQEPRLERRELRGVPQSSGSFGETVRSPRGKKGKGLVRGNRTSILRTNYFLGYGPDASGARHLTGRGGGGVFLFRQG